jgi:hypothetical protein
MTKGMPVISTKLSSNFLDDDKNDGELGFVGVQTVFCTQFHPFKGLQT